MDFEYRNGKQVTDYVNLITSILYRYPEVSTVNFEPVNNTLKFSFLLSNKITTAEFNEINQLLLDSIEAFNLIERRKPEVINISSLYIDNYTMIEIERDLGTLIQSEISLTVMSLQQLVKNNIIIEKTDNDRVDEQLQEEIINSLLLRVKNTKGDSPLLAFRDEGKVLVFNM